MSAAVQPHHTNLDDTPKVDLAKFGMITFLASEAMLFAGLISAYLILWISQGSAYQPEWLRSGEEYGKHPFTWPLLLTGINTIFLLTSSATLYMGEKAVVAAKPITGWLALTTLLGAIFVGVQCYEWTHLYREHIWFNTGATYTSNFFTLTGFHGLHVSIGVVFLAITTLLAAAGRFTPHRHSFMTCVSLYWHFVDVVWVLLFTIMYIVPFFIHPAALPERSAIP
ncbi:MAG: heme-copper oxidase subunit III [Rhodospirillales bacterium]|nr:heme-copper oxidase subunit III [Acetobacter sp.]